MSQHQAGPHISWAELACRDSIRAPYPLDLRSNGTLRPLVIAFEQIRQASGGQPIRILSAYRTPEHNRVVGGSPNSQHVHGRALDLQTPQHLPVAAFHAIVLEVARLTPHLGAVGLYDWGVHIDTRPRAGNRLAQWDLRSPDQVRV